MDVVPSSLLVTDAVRSRWIVAEEFGWLRGPLALMAIVTRSSSLVALRIHTT